jgi:hypothetical protein
MILVANAKPFPTEQRAQLITTGIERNLASCSKNWAEVLGNLDTRSLCSQKVTVHICGTYGK